MPQYPTLAQLAYPDDPCPPYEDLSETSDDDDDCDTNFMEGFMYDDHGELIPATDDALSHPVTSSAPVIEELPPSEVPRPQMPQTPNDFCRKRDVVVERDTFGKLGVKFTRMGPRMFFSFVGINSSAAKCGLGFGDLLIAVDGFNFSKMSGTQLMHALSRSPAKNFKFTVYLRPYDFVLDGVVTPDMHLRCCTKQGKALCSVKLRHVVRCGHIGNLKLLCIDEVPVFGVRDREMMSLFQSMIGQKIVLRVMPRQVYAYLTRRENKEQLRHHLQLSPRIL